MKFNKSKLAAAVMAAAAVSGAHAVSIDESGAGQVLIYPYYNTNNDFVTNVTIVNTQNVGKIVKFRMRESGNSQDVIDFNIYMSPRDVWKGVVRAVDRDGNKRANIISSDTTCTLPLNNKAITINGVGGLTLKDTGWDMNVIYPDVSDDDAREGYIEVIEIGTIDPDYYADTDGDGIIDKSKDKNILASITHENGVPKDCTVIEAAWTKGVGLDGNTALVSNWGGNFGVPAVDAPTGGLYGFLVLLNTAQGSAFIAEATAIDNYSTRSQHFLSDDVNNFLLPSLASGDVSSTMVAAPNVDGAEILTGWPLTIDSALNDGDPYTPYSGPNPLPIAHVLQSTNVVNSYFVDPNFEGATEWVLTFPMKKHGIFNGQFANGEWTFDSTTGEYTCATPTGAAIVEKWTDVNTLPGSDSDDSSDHVCFKGHKQDVEVSVIMWDQEESVLEDTDFGVSPPIAIPSRTLSREVNIISFVETGSSILGATKVENVNPGNDFKAGWATVSFNSKYCLTNSQLSDGTAGDFILASTPVTACGVPVIGFAALQGADFNIQEGTFFGESVEHRFARSGTATVTP